MDNVDAVLAELQLERGRVAAELARIDRVIETIAGLRLQQEAPVVAAVEVPPPPPPPDTRRWAYAALNIYEATAAYLKEAGTPQTSSEIANALRARGFRTRSKYFPGVVRTMLRRTESKRGHRIRMTSDGRRWFIAPRRSSKK